MLVSYVVTLFNKQPYLRHLLAGLDRQQGAFHKQFIFVDDGSTDATLTDLKRLTEHWRHTTIITQANQGPAVAMNAAIALATGDFIKPVDGDDYLLPWATSDLLGALQSSGLGLAYCDSGTVGCYDETRPPPGAAEIVHAPRPWQRESGSLRLSLRRARTTPSAWMASTALVREAGGCDACVFIQDYSAELRLAARTDFCRLDHTLFLAPNALGQRLSGNQAQTLHDCNKAVLRFLRQHPGLEAPLRRHGLRRASGRAWAWASRHNGETVFSKVFACHLRARLGWLHPNPEVERTLCAPFRAKVVMRTGQTEPGAQNTGPNG